jgi:NADPH:quinone reductase-like Zn-dependent oxidoreductase
MEHLLHNKNKRKNMNKDDVSTVDARKRVSKSRQVSVTGPTEDKKVMKAAAIDRFGPPSVLTLRTLPMPEPGPHEVVIALYAAGVGVWDAEIRKGWWPEGQPKFPLVLGTDGAGVVVAKGTAVRRFDLGDRVWAYEFINPKGGFYAEYVAVNSQHVGLIPTHLNWLKAGGATVTGLTALQGVDAHLRVRRGETVLIFGASGAVGTLAVQFAKGRGARVIATARGTVAKRLVRRLGADKVIDPTDSDAVEQIRAFAPNGLDAALALAGGDSLDRLLALLRSGGRIAYPNGVEPEPHAPRKIKSISYDAEAGPRQFTQLNRAADETRLQVPIAAARPLHKAAEAHERIEKGHVLGRIVLQIRGKTKAGNSRS